MVGNRKITGEMKGGEVEKTNDKSNKYMNCLVSQKVINVIEKKYRAGKGDLEG